MTERCKQELCPNWSGDGNVCPCAIFDLDTPDDPYQSLEWANGEPWDDDPLEASVNDF